MLRPSDSSLQGIYCLTGKVRPEGMKKVMNSVFLIAGQKQPVGTRLGCPCSPSPKGSAGKREVSTSSSWGAQGHSHYTTFLPVLCAAPVDRAGLVS